MEQLGMEELFYTAAVAFEAARQVSILPKEHRSWRLHGHSFTARVRVRRREGWARFPGDEVEELRRRLSRAIAPLDYQHLNIKLAQPTDENIARWIRKYLDLSGITNVGVQSPEGFGRRSRQQRSCACMAAIWLSSSASVAERQTRTQMRPYARPWFRSHCPR